MHQTEISDFFKTKKRWLAKHEFTYEKTKLKRTNWTDPVNAAFLENACNEARMGMSSQHSLSTKYNIPQGILSKNISGKRTAVTGLGRCQVLPVEMETLINNYVIKMDDAGFGIDKKIIRQIASKIFLKMKSPFITKFKATRRWLQGFIKRHPEISARRAQGFNRLRAGGLNRESVKHYLTILQDAHNFCIEHSAYLSSKDD